MRTLKKNQQSLYYANPIETTEICDGVYRTGEYTVKYGKPIKACMNISPEYGAFEMAQYGTNDKSKFSDSVTNMETSDIVCRVRGTGSCLAIGWSKDQPFLCWSTLVSTSDTSNYTTGFCDGWYNSNTSGPCVYSGAVFASTGAGCGLSCFGRVAASNPDTDFGGRLLKTAS